MRAALLLVCFFLSGAASLMDQVVWLRYLSLTFGNTTYAAATLLAVFMGGLGLGAALFGRLADRWRRPLLIYCLLEIGLGLVAVGSPHLFSWIDAAYVHLFRELGSQPLLFVIGRAALAALLLGPPTMMMGGTLPLVVRGAAGVGGAGRATALLYAVNTLGAASGVAVAGFVSIRLLGLPTTLTLAATANLLAALGALIVDRPREVRSGAPPAPARAPLRAPLLLVLVAAMGATSLAYEVLWTRILVFYLGSSVYAYSLMLLMILLGIGIGSLFVAPWVEGLRSPLLALVSIEVGIGVTATAGVFVFLELNTLLEMIVRAIGATGIGGVMVAQLLAISPILGPPTLLMGISFPIALRALHERFDTLGRDLGSVYGANTLGAVIGSLGAGFGLIPLLGTQTSLLVVATVNILIGLAFLHLGRTAPAARVAWLALAVPVLVIRLLPDHEVILAAGMFRHDEPGTLVYIHEDAQASVMVRRLEDQSGPYNSLEVNGVNVAGTSPDLYAVQKMQGHLPLLLHQEPRRVLHIGFGSGGTAWAVSRHPVEEIRIVEISPEVIRASDRMFPDVNHGVLADPRVAVEINDGRNFLLATDETFDAILSDSIHPRYAGNGSLYSAEYFELLARRLAPGGVASMWLPMYSLAPRNYAMILAAFQEAFPRVDVWYEPSSLNAFTIVTGRDQPGSPLTNLEKAFSRPGIREELEALGIRGPADVVACHLVGTPELASWLASVEPLSDDRPAVEYESSLLMSPRLAWLNVFSRLLELRAPTPSDSLLAPLSAGLRSRTRARYQDRTEVLLAHRELLRLQIERSFFELQERSR